eukprot:scaffold122215_cov36-Phaeocystis_antarctica.AAC.2
MAREATDAAAAAASDFAVSGSVEGGGGGGGGGGADDMAGRLLMAVGQAAEWRRAQGRARPISWRVRALGHGGRRVQRLPSRAGSPVQALFTPSAVCIVDAGVCVFVWVGPVSMEEEETLAMQLAHTYAQQATRVMQVTHALA